MKRQARVAVIDSGSQASLLLEAQAKARGSFIIVAYYRRLLSKDLGAIAAHWPDVLVVDGQLARSGPKVLTRLNTLAAYRGDRLFIGET